MGGQRTSDEEKGKKGFEGSQHNRETCGRGGVKAVKPQKVKTVLVDKKKRLPVHVGRLKNQERKTR